MIKSYLLSIFFIISVVGLQAQQFPEEGAVLNYRLAGFTAKADEGAAYYRFEIARMLNGKPGDIIISQTENTNRAIITLPAFGEEYAWRTVVLNKKKKAIKTTPFTTFKTGQYVTVDTNQYRLVIASNEVRDTNLYVLMDYTTVIYNLKGEALWYLPNIKPVDDKHLQMRDVKATPFGTFTATTHSGAFEFDYNGKILWQAPNDGTVSGDTSENYHHEFTRLNNGNYMVAGAGSRLMKVPSYYQIKPELIASGLFEKKDDGYYRTVPTDNLIEYNSKKEIVWYWKSIDHFSEQDFFRQRNYGSNGMDVDMHLNSFYFDETEKVIYLSFRNMDEIVKIEYPSGKILNRYGEIKDQSGKSNEHLFYGQHCVFKDSSGKIYLFDNNTNRKLMMTDSGRANAVSKAIIIRETSSDTGVEKIWNFDCDIDTLTDKHGGAGGSVDVMPDNNLLVSMGSAGRLFIVTPDKKVIWNALPQSGDVNKNWYKIGPYRARILTRKQIEKIIYHK